MVDKCRCSWVVGQCSQTLSEAVSYVIKPRVCFVRYVLLISILFITRHEGETQKGREERRRNEYIRRTLRKGEEETGRKAGQGKEPELEGLGRAHNLHQSNNFSFTFVTSLDYLSNHLTLTDIRQQIVYC